MASAWDASARSRFLIAADCAAGISEWLAHPTTTSERPIREIPEPRSWRICFLHRLDLDRLAGAFTPAQGTLSGGPKRGTRVGPRKYRIGPHCGSLLQSVAASAFDGSLSPQNRCSVPLVWRYRLGGDSPRASEAADRVSRDD